MAPFGHNSRAEGKVLAAGHVSDVRSKGIEPRAAWSGPGLAV